MPLPDSAPIGSPCWIDLTADPDKSRAFYGELFGWTADEAGDDYGGYINFAKDGHRVAGCMKNEGQAPMDVWSVYLATADIEATATKAKQSGGQVMIEPMDVMELGRMSVLSDAGGRGDRGLAAGRTQGLRDPRRARRAVMVRDLYP